MSRAGEGSSVNIAGRSYPCGRVLTLSKHRSTRHPRPGIRRSGLAPARGGSQPRRRSSRPGAPAARAPPATSRRRSSPVGGRPRAVWNARSDASVAAVKRPPAGTSTRRVERREVLLQPEHLVAPGALAQRRPARVGRRRRAAAPAASARPTSGARRLPAPPRHPAGAVARPDRAEALDLGGRRRRRRPARAAPSARRRCGSGRRSWRSPRRPSRRSPSSRPAAGWPARRPGARNTEYGKLGW